MTIGCRREKEILTPILFFRGDDRHTAFWLHWTSGFELLQKKLCPPLFLSHRRSHPGPEEEMFRVFQRVANIDYAAVLGFFPKNFIIIS
jgi:hypothetical protein